MPVFAGKFRILLNRIRNQGIFAFAGHQCRSSRFMLTIGLVVATFMAAPMHALAQELNVGDAFVTQFSGTRLSGDGSPVIDPDGAVAQAIDLRNPGGPPAGLPWRDAPTKLQVLARDTGQVFGIAFDNQSPANIYLTATSAYGLHWDDIAGTWMEGQWGQDGDPGTIYKLDASNGYRPTIFSRINLDGRLNSAAGLGNITFNGQSSSLYVSDLESGMIYHLDLAGNILERYDHGVTGRSQFIEAATGAVTNLPGVAFDPASDAQVESCETGVFSNTPECWNIADFRRRVWGVAAHTDASSQQTRLYYALWSSQGFGNPDWSGDVNEQQNSIWSIGLSAQGAFDTNDIRREFAMPGFSATQEDYQRAGASNPVSDIALDDNGEMALAERGGMRNLGLSAQAPFAWPDEARTVRARRGDDGVWIPVGRHDISWYDRKDLGPPYLRAAGSGGVDFGYGYSPAGVLETGQRDRFVWSTGDLLCRPESPCSDGVGDVLNGLQGQPSDILQLLNPDTAYGDYPDAGPATPDDGPAGSYFVQTSPQNMSSWNGDVEILKGTGTPSAPGNPDLAVSKLMPDFCLRGSICTANISVSNVGTADWNGPIFLRDFTVPPALGFLAVGAPWQCLGIGGETACYHAFVTLKPGQSLPMVLDIAVANNFAFDNINNCVAIDWPLTNPANPASIVASVQKTLTLLGYDPGPIDGAMGPKTAAAIAQLQSDYGMPITGAIDAATLELLYAGSAFWSGDGNPSNDEACDNSQIIGNPPPGGIHLPVGSRPGHLAPGSIHQPIGSAPAHVFPNSVHLPLGSAPAHVFPNSIHLPIGSNPGHLFPNSIHLPIGSNPGHLFPNSIHLPIGSGGHLFPQSIHLPLGSNGGHQFPQSLHLPLGSNPGHQFPQSIHLPIGSNPGHQFPQSLHLPIGSNPGHQFPQSLHLPLGSNPGHQFPQSVHLPIGSNPGHQFPQSLHLPLGSNPGHQFPQSIHLPIGSVPQHKFPQSLHLPLGSNPGHQFPKSVHLPIGSNPGHKFPQSLHLPLGSNPGHQFPKSIHLPIGSVPQHQFPQSIHLPLGSVPQHVFPQSVHLPVGSAPQHVFPKSLHLPLGSDGGHQFPNSIHLPLGSDQGHNFPVSIHLPIGSVPQHQFPKSVHLPVGSIGGHKFPNSIHLPIGSNPQHLLPKSVHLPIGSVGNHAFPKSIHLPVGSVGHQPIGSVHLPAGSITHKPAGSIHLPVGSTGHKPVGSIHIPVGSKIQIHQPSVSNRPVHRPRGSVQTIKPVEPVHKPRGSVQIHLPVGSTPQIHLPIGSKPQVHKPRGSVQIIEPVKPVHKPRGSVQVHKPRGSVQTIKPVKPVHKPRGSVQTIKPVKPVHKPRGSVQIIKPVKPVHKPRGSVQTIKPVKPVHKPRGSVQIIKPVKPVHKPRGSVQKPKPVKPTLQLNQSQQNNRKKQQQNQNQILKVNPKALNQLQQLLKPQD